MTKTPFELNTFPSDHAADLLTQVSHTGEVEHGGTSLALGSDLTSVRARAMATELTKRLPGFTL